VRTQRAGRKGWAAGAAGGLGLAALVAVVLLALSAGGRNHGYTVRAIFDDAANVISGEEIKIDGVKVGTVGSVTATPQAKAAVVLKIENPGFQNFRQDASCTIRPQALIGEKYVDCLPTQSRVEGTPLPPPLNKIPSGQEGEGQYLLPVTRTSSPVDVDLLGDISRLPERQRLTLIINEFGAGLAGRGSDLNVVIRRADPALQELDKVLSILASENQVLSKLAVDSDQALAPLARVRGNVASFIAQSNTVAQASAAHRGALAKNLSLFPPFLKQLKPSMERLGRFAEQTTPTFADLHKAAPSINKAFTELPGFSNASSTFFTNLGKNGKTTGPAIVATQPLLKELKSLGTAANPFSTNLSALLESLKGTGGLERLLDFIFLGAGASNGYDELGHFLRTEGVGNLCLKYYIEPSNCSRHLFNKGTAPSGTATVAGGKEGTSLVMARTLAVVEGATPAQAIAKYPGSAPSVAEMEGAGASTTTAATSSPSSSQPVGGSTSGTTYYSPSSEGSSGGMLLNYLLGN
jgi:phospholipid/cholesterol/gamma-HCH transport system substrate-binding protein